MSSSLIQKGIRVEHNRYNVQYPLQITFIAEFILLKIPYVSLYCQCCQLCIISEKFDRFGHVCTRKLVRFDISTVQVMRC